MNCYKEMAVSFVTEGGRTTALGFPLTSPNKIKIFARLFPRTREAVK